MIEQFGNELCSRWSNWHGKWHDDVMKWKHFPRYWPFVRGIHRTPVNSPQKRPVTWSFDVFFDLRPNKRLSKQWWGWWFETSLRPLWRRCNGLIFNSIISQNAIHPKPNCDRRSTVGVWQWISYFITHFTGLLWLLILTGMKVGPKHHNRYEWFIMHKILLPMFPMMFK